MSADVSNNAATEAAAKQPHRRYDPLRDRWILVSPQRTQRPWQGEEEAPPEPQPEYDPHCYLCPGNARAGGKTNPVYDGVYVFDNDFPALLDDGASPVTPQVGLFAKSAVNGRCRVICYSPRHDLSMASMSVEHIHAVVDTWAAQVEELSERYAHVQLFENRGAAMGCSNPHPHGQIWALDAIPSEIAVEDRQQADYLRERGVPLLLDYANEEMERGERLVCHNDHWLVVVPWWATWPFEVLLLPRMPVTHMPSLDREQRENLARILSQLLRGYDLVFRTPFPYSMGWHGAPSLQGGSSEHWQLHAHFYPPLLRSASVKKHMVGFEMLSESQRDLTPEQAAARLREVVPTRAGAGASSACGKIVSHRGRYGFDDGNET